MPVLNRYDVAVIGAGLAGLQAARLLARRGLAVLLVDVKADVGEGVHTSGIFVRRTLDDFSLPEGCLGPPVRHVRLWSPGRRRLDLSGPHDEFRVGRMAALYRHYLVQCLRSGVHWLARTRYEGSVPVAGGSLLYLETVGHPWAAEARFLIGADGATSRVAADLGLDRNRQWIVGAEVVLAGCPLTGRPASSVTWTRRWRRATWPGWSTTARRCMWALAAAPAASNRPGPWPGSGPWPA